MKKTPLFLTLAAPFLMPLYPIHAAAQKKVEAIQQLRFEVPAEMTPLLKM